MRYYFVDGLKKIIIEECDAIGVELDNGTNYELQAYKHDNRGVHLSSDGGLLIFPLASNRVLLSKPEP